ncbi:uncharacterized protein (TIGR00251 family) [Bosea sp. BE125]|uniref:DUF167 family protein n=1 Tax=Bosea sp. BE125 TaxID=2817909 RepID=UPI00285B570B|nr:DUF167 family protein [Bosea sp. BE125]MDR6873525.1 uncharacterized protein (TIGR00251 family) [Bosea sp. BE125]
MPAWRESQAGLLLCVRLTPRGGRDGLDGIETLADGREVLKVRVRAAPSDGQANAALVALLAKLMGLPRSRVMLVAGASARLKSVPLEGDSATLLARLEAFLAAG